MSKEEFDYDLVACLEYNPQSPFTINDVKEVLAVWEGVRDESDWDWVLKLNDGRFVYLNGGCDYTGWDCRSSADSQLIETPESVLKLVDSDRQASIKEQLESRKLAPSWRDFVPEEIKELPVIELKKLPWILPDREKVGE